MSGFVSMLEQVLIKPSRAAKTARGFCDHDPVHINKPPIAGTEPEEIRAVVVGVLIERQQEGVEISDSPRQERLADHMLQALGPQPGQLLRMRVVQRKQRDAQRFAVRRFGCKDRLRRLIMHRFHLDHADNDGQKNTRAHPRSD